MSIRSIPRDLCLPDMETLQGSVTNCQHTLKVSGGANNTSTTTTYIALFRVNGRPVQFRSSQPSSLSDGDQVKVAGSPWNGALDALACRNVTTGETMSVGSGGYLVGALAVPIIGLGVCVLSADKLGTLIVLAILAVAALITAYLAYRGTLVARAERLVAG